VGDEEQPRPSSPWKWVIIGCLAVAVLGTCCVGGIAASGYFVYQQATATDPTVNEFLAKVKAGDRAGAYEAIDQEWKDVQTPEQFDRFIRMVDDIMGGLRSKTRQSWNVKALPGKLQAQIVYSGTFEKGEGVMTIVLFKKGEVWRVAGFTVNSHNFDNKGPCPNCGKTTFLGASFCYECGKPFKE